MSYNTAPTLAHAHQHFINGQWVDSLGTQRFTVINPATEQPLGEITLGNAADAEAAIRAAHAAFPAFAATTREERLALLTRIIAIYQRRFEEIVVSITAEMGAPINFSRSAQTQVGLTHLEVARDILQGYAFEHPFSNGMVRREPVGVCGLITPWNWPMNQIALKVAPALATGCTMVLKPSEFSPFTAILFAEILAEAGVPAGVFNLVQGDGPTVGSLLSSHPLVDMISLTGSTRAGIAVAQQAAPTIKRVTLELGGKSANILLDDVDWESVVPAAVAQCYVNCGQGCSAATRLLVPATQLEHVNALAKHAAENYVQGDPTDPATQLGPVVSNVQWERIQTLIKTGVVEGATVLTGGAGRPAHLPTGYYVQPTIFTNVNNSMTVAQEEIFGPVLVIIPYTTEAEAIAIANDTRYGLSGYVSSANRERALAVARQLRTGTVNINTARADATMPFGGYKHSGNGREKGLFGFEEYLEVKAIAG
ncbi:MAG: aldehyde dehydrogenase family protein [Alphaproteobacteria bacterium]